jgi:hypothetical protein
VGICGAGVATGRGVTGIGAGVATGRGVTGIGAGVATGRGVTGIGAGVGATGAGVRGTGAAVGVTEGSSTAGKVGLPVMGGNVIGALVGGGCGATVGNMLMAGTHKSKLPNTNSCLVSSTKLASYASFPSLAAMSTPLPSLKRLEASTWNCIPETVIMSARE